MKQFVLVHGYLGSALNWGPVISRLRAHPELVGWEYSAVNLLGHAYRPLASGQNEITLEEMARDLESQIPAGSFYALGHSFGLRPLLKFNSLFPGRLQGLIAEDSVPQISPNSFNFLRTIVEETPVPFPDRESVRKYFDDLFPADKALSRFLQSNIRPDAQGLMNWRFHAPALAYLLQESYRTPLWNEWSQFDKPVHMIVGELSTYVTPEILMRCQSTRAAATVVHQISQSGHWVHVDQFELFMNCLVNILKDWA